MSQCPTCATFREMLDSMATKYHELAMTLATPAAEKAVEFTPIEPDAPPAVVLEAMRKISPIRDRTYDANWAYWERNKAHAALHPDAFADEILTGAQFYRTPADAAPPE